MRKWQHVSAEAILLMLMVWFHAACAEEATPDASLVHVATWMESWPRANGKTATHEVEGGIWNEAIQTGLKKHNAIHLPQREQPYYLDGPIILQSGQTLTADPKAEIRLKPGSNTCMVRNERVAGFGDKPVPTNLRLDTDIHIEGGIWTTLATTDQEINGNQFGRSAKTDAVAGTHGVILLQNVRRATVKNVTVRQSKPFAVHLANVHEFTVDGVVLDRHQRDGVHVNGPATCGVIRGVRGDSRDDDVALNAWDWKNCAPTFGPIEQILVEDITGLAEDHHSGNIAIRLLPGVKDFGDGRTLDCPVRDVTLRRITNIRHFKAYAQPNLELGRDKDSSAGIGSINNLRLEELIFERPGVIELHADTDGLAINNVRLNHELPREWHLLAIGPKSQTYKYGRSEDPARWTEIFSPELDCTLRNLSIAGVRKQGSEKEIPIERLVHVIEQKPNRNYPQTTPRGGKGKGIWIR